MEHGEKFPRMHVSLYVSDVNATVAFYNAFFGQEADKVKGDYAKYILDKPSLIISFVQNETRVQSNFGHLGFQVETEEQLKQSLEAAQNQNIKILEEMGTNCCYAFQDKYWVSDPDGHRWEVYYFHEDSEFNDPKYASESTTACCMPPATEKKKVSLSSLQILDDNCEPGSNCC